MERLLDLKTPPVPGREYLVPVTTVNGCSIVPVPVVGVEHNDREIGAIDLDHIHVDRRFVTNEELGRIGFSSCELENARSVAVLNTTLTGSEALKIWEEPRMCVADDFPQSRDFKAGRFGLLSAEASDLRGKGVTHLNMDCKICPHKGTRLDNCKPRDGVLLCPAHGMEFDAETGEILRF